MTPQGQASAGPDDHSILGSLAAHRKAPAGPPGWESATTPGNAPYVAGPGVAG